MVKDYKFVEYKISTYHAIPENQIKVSPYGIKFPIWLHEKFKEALFTRIKILVDKDESAILLRGTKGNGGGYKIGKHKLFAKGLVKQLGIKIPLLCSCILNDKYQGWIVDVKNGKEYIKNPERPERFVRQKQ